MATAYYRHDDCLEHVTPPGHPEQVARLEAIAAALSRIDGLDRREAPMGRAEDVLRCHTERYLEMIRAASPADGWVSLDADTHMSPGTLTAAWRAVGGCLAAVDAVMAGEVANAFVGCRPPGHHAETERAMGFCLFGNVAIAAKHALGVHGLERVAVVDFDVHHGNGTQDLLWEEERSLFVSSHEMPLFPGTGRPDERGAYDNVINIPLAPGTGGPEMRALYEREVIPALDDFAPELVLISAGFDAHAADPLATLRWTEADFVWVTEAVLDVADAHAGGRVVSTLEGGYDLNALGASVAAHVGVLMERGG